LSDEESGAGKEKPPSKQSESTGEFVLEKSGETVLSHEEKAAKPPGRKHIHERRPAPMVPEAPPKPDEEDDKETLSSSGGGSPER
jgi:hypothetical protein